MSLAAGAAAAARGGCGLGRRQDHRVDDVDHAVRSHHVGRHDVSAIDHGLAVHYLERYGRTLQRLGGQAILHGGGLHRTGHDVVEQDVGQRLRILEQGFDRARRELRKRFVSGGEDRERPLALERSDQTSGLHRGHQGVELASADCGRHNVFSGSGFRSAVGDGELVDVFRVVAVTAHDTQTKCMLAVRKRVGVQAVAELARLVAHGQEDRPICSATGQNIQLPLGEGRIAGVTCNFNNSICRRTIRRTRNAVLHRCASRQRQAQQHDRCQCKQDELEPFSLCRHGFLLFDFCAGGLSCRRRLIINVYSMSKVGSVAYISFGDIKRKQASTG